jgi:formate hydrogenlyase transcriptional activator
MSAQTSWANETFAMNRTSSLDEEGTASAKGTFDDREIGGKDLATIIGTSTALHSVLGMVRLVAPTDSTVLINGETGTGKELIAEAIHKCSHRSNRPFVKVNCAAIPAGLLESELFGHERGAYTGAVTRGIGRFERAHRGTLFLDEIGDLPLELQPKLLRVMQERKFERLGGAATIHTDVRVICATHRNLVEMISERQFRADLFYRLGVFPIELPPLRDRPEDIPLLAHHFAMGYAARMHKRITSISEEHMTALVRHSWPGNVRELQNLIERSVILSTSDTLSSSLPDRAHTTQDGANWSTPAKPRTLEQAQRSHILEALQQTKGVIGGRNGAAVQLGLPRTTLIFKMKRLGINREHSSAFRVRALAAPPSAEGSVPPSALRAHEAASSDNSKPRSDTGRVCTLAEAEREPHFRSCEDAEWTDLRQAWGCGDFRTPPSTLRSR